MGLFDTTLQDVDPTKKPNMQPPQPPAADPNQWIKDAMTKVAGMPAAAAEGVRGMFAPQPAPTVVPLHTGEAANAILPALQTADTYMRDKAAAVPGLLKDAAGTAGDLASSAYTGAKGMVNSAVAAGQAENQRIQAIDNTPTERPGTVMGGLQNLGARIKNGLLDAGVLSSDILSKDKILTPAEQHAAGTPTPAAAPAPAAATPASPTPAAQGAPAPAMTPGAAAYQKSVDEWKPKNGDFAGAQLANIVAGAQPAQDRTVIGKRGDGTPIYAAEVQGSPQAAGMPAPQGVEGSIGQAGFAKQLANIKALDDGVTGGYNELPDQNAAWNARMDRNSLVSDMTSAMRQANSPEERAAIGHALSTAMSGDGNLAVENVRQSGQNTRQAGQDKIHMRGQDIQARGQDLTHGLGMLQNMTAQRGQDLNAASHRDTVAAQRYGTDVNAGVQIAGQQNTAQVHAADAAAALQRTQQAGKDHIEGNRVLAQAGTNKSFQSIDGKYVMPGQGTYFHPGGKGPDGKVMLPGIYPLPTFQLPKKPGDTAGAKE